MDIYVYADWRGMKEVRSVGVLSVVRTKGRSVFSFVYEQQWLEGLPAQLLDPDLQLYGGPQYLANGKSNFGMFLDSSPDRWGRVLMDRRESLIARKEGRKPRKLFEEDYLLGVYDKHRMGGLRFKTEPGGDFLNDNTRLAAPPWTSLRELEEASLQLEKETLGHEETLKWINLLLAPGASLGGARPKAGVLDLQGQLWIAKFPSVKDTINVGGWEMVACQLAQMAGIRMSAGEIRRFNSEHHTFLTKRFDRIEDERIHFASAMTLLGHQDGDSDLSYLELVEFIQRHGAQVRADLEELFRRVVFNIAIKNTDDHLRNHGFLLAPNGWILSPAYDINPVYYGTGLTLNISDSDNALDFELARSMAPHFRLNDKQALTIIKKVKEVRQNWKTFAVNLGISKKEQDMMESAFIDG